MTNNKQQTAVKLYTEEQVRKMLEVCIDSDLYEHILTFEDILKTQTHIELPSDEEIEKFINTLPFTQGLDDGQYNDGVIYGAIIGIDWMRDKIQGGEQ
jgi:hypothetical protein